MTPHDQLLQKLEQYDPRQIPCRGDDGDRWISGTPRDQWHAADACQSCPARIACASYAVEAEEPAGVWGGTTPTERASLARQKKLSDPKHDRRDVA